MAAAKLTEGDNGDPLTEDEARAINALRRLDKIWPRTLTLASMGGSLVVFHTGDPRWDGDKNSSAERAGVVLAGCFLNIPNDGGDW